ncbi:MAG: alpha/beta fold hydrolase [Ktedonobacterales bacterium]
MTTQFTTQFLDVSAGRLAYDDSATNNPDALGRSLVICAPSMGDVRAEYRFLAPQLVAAGYRVVTLDVRGHGESSVGWPDYSVAAIGADMLALARALGDGKSVYLIGDSMAGGAAVWAAAEAPNRVRGMILIDPVVRDMGPLWMGRLLSAVLFARPWGPSIWTRYVRMLYPTVRPADFSDYLTHLRANLRELGRITALQHMIAASKAASEARLDQVTAPTLVIMGEKDPDFRHPEREAQFVAGRLHGQMRMMVGAGHYPHAEMPERTVPEIVAFLNEVNATLAAAPALVEG